MKKLLGIVILGLLLSGNAYAAICSDSISVSGKRSGDYVIYTFSNSSDKKITITKFGPLSTSNQIMKKVPVLRIGPFGKKTHKMYIGNLNLGVYKKSYRWSCKFGNIVAKKYTSPPIKRCSETDYDTPCTCERESNAATKKYCELRKKNANKTTRSEAAGYCARRAEEYSKEVGAEYYKDCMKDEGF